MIILNAEESKRYKILTAPFTEKEWNRVEPFLDDIEEYVYDVSDPYHMFLSLQSCKDEIIVSILSDMLDKRIKNF